MIDLKWDFENNDIYIDSDLALVDSSESMAQRIANSVHLLRGTWFLDLRDGVDWVGLLGNGNRALIDSAVRSVARNVEGVDSIVRYKSNAINDVLVIEMEAKEEQSNTSKLITIEV